MKLSRLLFAMFILFQAPVALFAQGWEHIHPATEINDLKDAVWFNGDTAFVCGLNWTLLQTVDGGSTWKNVLNEEHGFDIIRISTDGDLVYFSATYPEWYDFDDARDTLVPFFSYNPRTGSLEDISFSVGPSGTVPSRAYLLPPVQVSENFVYNEMTYLPGEIYRMDTRTREWSPIPYPGQIMASMPLSDDVYFYIGIQPPDYEQRFACITTDQGATWQIDTVYNLPPDVFTGSITSAPLGNAVRMVLATGFIVFVSDDTGKTWQTTEDIPWQTKYSPGIMSVVALTSEHWYILDREGGVYETRNAGQTWLQLKESEVDTDIYTTLGDMRIMAANGEGGILLPRQFGWITQSENGGITWDLRLKPVIANVSRMHFFNLNEGVMLGTSHDRQMAMFATTDGGESWEQTGPLSNSSTEGWSSLNAFDEIYSFRLYEDSIAGARFEQYLTSDQGRTWELQYTSDVGRNVGRLWTLDEVYVITLQNDADSSGMYVSDNRGRSWTFHATEQLLIPRDVQCGRNADGNAEYFMIPTVPRTALLYRSTDGCRSWEPWYSASISAGDRFDELDVTSADTIALRFEYTLHITTSGRAGFEKYPVPVLAGNPIVDAEYIYLWPEKLAVKRGLFVASTNDDWATHTVQLAKSAHTQYFTNWFFLDRNHGWISRGPEIWRTSTGGVNWVRSAPGVPEGFGITSVYPNPVTMGGSVNIQVTTVGAQRGSPELRRAVPMRVAVHDVLGRMTAMLHEGPMDSQARTLSWNTHTLRPGLYFITASSGMERSVRPIAVMK